MDRTRLYTTLMTVVVLALAVLPAAVVFGFGWLSFGHPTFRSGAVPGDTTRPEVWVLFVLFYLAWMFGLMVLTIWAYDRLGHHWRSWDRAPRKEKKRVMRLSAGLGFLAGQQRARAQAEAQRKALPVRKSAKPAPGTRPAPGIKPAPGTRSAPGKKDASAHKPAPGTKAAPSRGAVPEGKPGSGRPGTSSSGRPPAAKGKA
jgi:hypothetical protein